MKIALWNRLQVVFSATPAYYVFELTWSGVSLVRVDAVHRGAAHVPWQVNMDGSHDAEDEAGLQHPDEVSGALALVAGHKLLPGLGNEDVGVGKEGAKDATHDAHEDGGEDSDDVDRDEIFGSELRLEQPKIVLVLEPVEGGVEQIRGEGCRHAAEKHLPRQLVLPKGRHLFHGEKQTAHWSSKCRCNSGSRACRNEVPPVF